MLVDYQGFLENLDRVRKRISRACEECGRDPKSVNLLPVTKTHPIDAARYAAKAGITAVGENRVQEALGKIKDADFELAWELIGPLQSNKAKPVAESMSRVQSVDRLKIVNLLQRHASEAGRTLPVLLQVNAGEDPNKAGVMVEEAEALLDGACEQPNLDVQGLMTIAPLSNDPDVARRCFARLRECRDDLRQNSGLVLLELSMGMSSDMEIAISEGSTIVRVGSDLFGPRDY